MRLELTGRHVDITPAVRKAVEQRLARVTRLLNDRALSAQVVITKEKTRVRAEVTLHARGERFFHGEAMGKTMDLALGAATEKVDHQAQKQKSRWVEGRRRGVSAAKAASAAPRPERARGAFGNGSENRRNGPGDPEQRRRGVPADGDAAEQETRAVRIIRARRYEVKPMSVDEAALEVGDGQEAFIVFRNASTDTINVLFRRPDGHLGLIEPEA
jgi:putative sigma-54 modulation protein